MIHHLKLLRASGVASKAPGSSCPAPSCSNVAVNNGSLRCAGGGTMPVGLSRYTCAVVSAVAGVTAHASFQLAVGSAPTGDTAQVTLAALSTRRLPLVTPDTGSPNTRSSTMTPVVVFPVSPPLSTPSCCAVPMGGVKATAPVAAWLRGTTASSTSVAVTVAECNLSVSTTRRTALVPVTLCSDVAYVMFPAPTVKSPTSRPDTAWLKVYVKYATGCPSSSVSRDDTLVLTGMNCRWKPLLDASRLAGEMAPLPAGRDTVTVCCVSGGEIATVRTHALADT